MRDEKCQATFNVAVRFAPFGGKAAERLIIGICAPYISFSDIVRVFSGTLVCNPE
jgi:hypothetical protein